MWSRMLTVLLGLFVTQVFAQDQKPETKPGVVRVETATITATVEAIDYESAPSISKVRGEMW